MPNLHFVTSNLNKVREAESILDVVLQRSDIDLPELQTLEVDEVARAKAEFAYTKIGQPVFVEDTGIYITVLKGFPGALGKWVQHSAGWLWLCRSLGDDRRAYAKTSIGYHDGKQIRLFTGRVDGTIALTPRGTSGFGFDPIFIPQGYDATYAEMGGEQKNKISMRRIAFLAFKDFIFRGF